MNGRMPKFFSSRSDTPTPPEIGITDIRAAQSRLRDALRVTPVTYSNSISERVGHDVLLKWENKHRTGSFKERGALNSLTLLSPKEHAAGVCAASLGNHALALSSHAARLSIPCTIVMPSNAPLVKIQSTRNTGAEVVLHGLTLNEAYEHALAIAERRRMRFVPAFDDVAVVAGQGTCGLEILEQVSDLDSVVVPVGGGGLISGIALAIKTQRPEVFVLGVQSEWATRRPDLVPDPQPLIPSMSIADGIAVKRPGKITGPLVSKYVDKLVSLSETEIAASIIGFLELEKSVVEGAGAVGLGATLRHDLPSTCKKTVIVVSGSNIDTNMLSRLIERDMGDRGRLLKLLVSVPDRPGSLHIVTGMFARAGANVLEVLHDRSFSEIPGNVDITFCLEVKDVLHRQAILKALSEGGIAAHELV